RSHTMGGFNRRTSGHVRQADVWSGVWLDARMSNSANIACPKCGAEIPLSEAVSHRVREELAAEFDKQRLEQNEALAKREGALQNLKEQLDERQRSVEQVVAERLEAERKNLSAQAAHDAEEKVSVQIKDLRAQLEGHQTKLKTAQAAELALLSSKRQLEEAQESLKLDLARQLDAERNQIAEKARQQTIESDRLKLADKDNKILDL